MLPSSLHKWEDSEVREGDVLLLVSKKNENSLPPY
jgi:hypothetical protein